MAVGWIAIRDKRLNKRTNIRMYPHASAWLLEGAFAHCKGKAGDRT